MNGKPLNFTLPDAGRLRLLIGVNPIALDASDEWLYYGTMNGNSMYRIRTTDLINADLTNEQLGQRTERFSGKPICDGISVDDAGNIYISDLQANAIGVIARDGTYRKLVVDPRISWPESFSFGPDGFLYFVASQLHLSAPLNEGINKARPPFYVFRMKALAPGVVGR
jgi:sugar lactone lactonase YvrE